MKAIVSGLGHLTGLLVAPDIIFMRTKEFVGLLDSKVNYFSFGILDPVILIRATG